MYLGEPSVGSGSFFSVRFSRFVHNPMHGIPMESLLLRCVMGNLKKQAGLVLSFCERRTSDRPQIGTNNLNRYGYKYYGSWTERACNLLWPILFIQHCSQKKSKIKSTLNIYMSTPCVWEWEFWEKATPSCPCFNFTQRKCFKIHDAIPLKINAVVPNHPLWWAHWLHLSLLTHLTEMPNITIIIQHWNISFTQQHKFGKTLQP